MPATARAAILKIDELNFIVPPNLVSAACFNMNRFETNVCLSDD
jgi:hypothetical protein